MPGAGGQRVLATYRGLYGSMADRPEGQDSNAWWERSATGGERCGPRMWFPERVEGEGEGRGRERGHGQQSSGRYTSYIDGQGPLDGDMMTTDRPTPR